MLSKPGFCNAWGTGVCVCVYGGGIHGVQDDGHVSGWVMVSSLRKGICGKA